MADEWLTSAEAAQVLGVTPGRIHALAKSGHLAYRMVGRLRLIDPVSAYRLKSSPTRLGRRLSPLSAWAALLSDLGTDSWLHVTSALGLSSQQRYRLKRLIARTSTEDWASLALSRATAYRYHVRPAYLDEILRWDGVVRSGVSATRAYNLDLVAPDEAEVYLTEETRRSLQDEFQLRAREPGNLVIRVPTTGLPIVLNRPMMPLAVIAVDLLDSGDPRSRRTALNVIERLAHHEKANPVG